MLFDDFQTIFTDECVYNKKKKLKEDYVILYLYFDDIMIFYSNIQVINITKFFWYENFDMMDLGLVNVILGIKLLKNNNGFALTQSYYIEKI
jgi:hypothetical protein